MQYVEALPTYTEPLPSFDDAPPAFDTIGSAGPSTDIQ